MSKKLMLISISGIQNFIAQAKSTKDLWAGSDMVSEIVGGIKKVVIEKWKDKKIIYNLEENNIDGDNPNFFIASFECNSNCKNEDLEEKIKIIIKESSIHYASMQDLPLYIVITDMENGIYGTAYSQLYRKFQAYKNDRLKSLILGADNQLNKENPNNPICILCGNRSSKEINKEINKEKICKVCTEKRDWFGNSDESFPTTTKIAEGGYYALIQIDIDDLGQYMSGRKGKLDVSELHKYQNELRIKLDSFLKNVKKKIEEISSPERFLIYCGGDDILFFCRLSKVMEIIGDIDLLLKDDLGNYAITCSKSIYIAHHMMPLRYVVMNSRKQLKKVKSYYSSEQKGGTAFTYLYRSSGVRTFYIKQKPEDDCYYKLNQLINIFKDNLISQRIIFGLEEVMVCFGEQMDIDTYEGIMPIVYNEIARIVNRKAERKVETKAETEAETKVEKIDNKEIIKLLSELLQYFIRYENNIYYVDFTSYFHLLHIAKKWNNEER